MSAFSHSARLCSSFIRVEIRLRNHAAVGFSPAIDTDSRDRLRVTGAGGPDDDRGDLTAHRSGGAVCAHGAPEFAACTASSASVRTLLASNASSATVVVTDGDTRCVSGGAHSALERGMVMDSGTGAKGADAHDGQTVLQRGKIIAQPSNLGNNSEFSRIGSLISPKRGELIVQKTLHNNDGTTARGRTQQWTASTCSENGTAARRTSRR